MTWNANSSRLSAIRRPRGESALPVPPPPEANVTSICPPCLCSSGFLRDPVHPQAILHASLDRAVLSVEKFSRWLRAICTILLSRNSAADRTKAIGYVEQAVGVLQEHAADDDPQVRMPVNRGVVCRANSCLRCSPLGLPHGRTALAHGYRLQYGHRVLAVRRTLRGHRSILGLH